jgi:hypothetical protein
MDSLLETDGARNSQMTLRTFNLWSDLIKQYSRCDLTQPGDKLYGMTGIVKLFEELTSDEYLAGLWKSRFVDMLDWRVYKPKPLLSLEYRAPSWSWASVDGPVHPQGSSPGARLLAELLKTTVVNQTSDRMSRVLGAVVILKARVTPAIFHVVNRPFATIQAPTGEFTVQVFPDSTSSDLKAGHQFSYMPLKLDYLYDSAGESSPTVTIVCLILERDTQSPGLTGRYRRLGHFNFDEARSYDIQSLFFSSDIREIEII